MKISIGINGYKNHNNLEKRERFCIESLIKCKTENVQLYNVCYEEENIQYKDFITLNKLKKKSNKIIYNYFQHEGLVKEYSLRKQEIDNNSKELPSVKEIFDALAATDCDYFLFLNNDIILSNRLFKNLNNDLDCHIISRMHIYDLESLQDTPRLESYSVHGFDAFLVKKTTWLKIRNNFPDLILGRFYWDTYYATLFKLLTKAVFVNSLPPVCFHIEHSSTSSQNTIENYYAEDLFKRNIIIGHLWFAYVQDILLKRPEVNNCKWYQPFSNEKQIEEAHFNQFNQKQFIDAEYKKLNVSLKTDYDLFIPVALKDEIKLPFVIEYANKHLKHNKIYICSPHKITNKVRDSSIEYINDRDVIDVEDKSFISFRPNWTYQQFLKLFFNFSRSEYYFALDADTILIKDLQLFEDEHPIWYYGWEQNHFPYFLFNKKVFNLDKSLSHTGIGDIGLFNKQITKTFLNYTGCGNAEELLRSVCNKMNGVCHFSEYETYANFVNTYYTGLYKFKHIEQENKGRDLNRGESWSTQDIKQTVDNFKHSNKSILSLHSWKI